MTAALAKLPPDYRDMLQILAAEAVDFLVVGGWAMSAHGHTRVTKDLDVFVRASEENAPRVVRALQRFGASLHGLDARDFAVPGVILQIGGALRIDVTTTIDGISFDEANVGRIAVDVDGVEVFVIGRAAMIANKRASNRLQDRVDVKKLEKPQR
jgi:hypothetical protein